MNIVEISMDKLIDICKQVYDRSLSGSAELRQTVIDEVISSYGIRCGDQWKVFSVKELSEFPINTYFTHSVWGRCWISQRTDGVKYMCFLDRGPCEFRSDVDPWDKEMKIISPIC